MTYVLLTVGIVLVLVVAMSAAGLVANRLPLGDPPGVLPRLATYLTRNVADTGASSGAPELAPFQLPGEPEAVLQAVADACRALGWESVAVDPEARRVVAVVRSSIFGFRDDVTITLTGCTAGGCEARVRSASRVGRGDLGANTRHIMDLRAQLSAGGRPGAKPAS